VQFALTEDEDLDAYGLALEAALAIQFLGTEFTVVPLFVNTTDENGEVEVLATFAVIVDLIAGDANTSLVLEIQDQASLEDAIKAVGYQETLVPEENDSVSASKTNEGLSIVVIGVIIGLSVALVVASLGAVTLLSRRNSKTFVNTDGATYQMPV
jgi:hypothetical protein